MLIDPETRRVEVYRLGDDGLWNLLDMSDGPALELATVDARIALGCEGFASELHRGRRHRPILLGQPGGFGRVACGGRRRRGGNGEMRKQRIEHPQGVGPVDHQDAPRRGHDKTTAARALRCGDMRRMAPVSTRIPRFVDRVMLFRFGVPGMAEREAVGSRQPASSAQSSTCNPFTRSNSRVLCVTSVKPSLRACAAM